MSFAPFAVSLSLNNMHNIFFHYFIKGLKNICYFSPKEHTFLFANSAS